MTETGRRRQRLIAGLLLALLTLLTLTVLAAPAAAEAPAAAAPVTVTLSAQPQDDGSVLLAARATSGGKPVSNLNITLSVMADFFGQRPVPIGSGTTDTSGTVAIKYIPTLGGHQQFLAASEGTPKLAPAKGTVEADVAAKTVPYRSAPPDLQPLRRWVGLTVIALTALVWLSLFTVFGRVVLALRAAPSAAVDPPDAEERTMTAD